MFIILNIHVDTVFTRINIVPHVNVRYYAATADSTHYIRRPRKGHCRRRVYVCA